MIRRRKANRSIPQSKLPGSRQVEVLRQDGVLNEIASKESCPYLRSLGTCEHSRGGPSGRCECPQSDRSVVAPRARYLHNESAFFSCRSPKYFPDQTLP